ncbi:MAG: TrkH family potassium uptake protein [Lachnospiraceae bacterium]|nr:TrkH family potassium uptake protein [Lachnospiraceae bacterium]
MNYSMIAYIIGWILSVEAALMVPSILVGFLYRESAVYALIISAVLCLLIGLPLIRKKPTNKAFYAREGGVIVALCWIIMSIMGSLPFILSGEISNPVDALFETVSGFTTTGASILASPADMCHCIMFWRCFTHWVGGMGVLVFLLTLLPMTGSGYHMSLMKAESPGPSVGKLVPKVQSTAKLLYGLYLALSLMQLVLLLLGGMPLFDSFCTVFGTAGTGGFGIKNDSFTSYSTYLQAVVTVFMILFGINFNVYFLFYMKRPKEAFQCEEAKWYLGVIAAATLIITFFIRDYYPNIFQSFHHAAFQVGSIITTTGFATADFNLWPTVPKTILVALMFCGACAGSTGGGMKVSRIILLFRTVINEIHLNLRPNAVKRIYFEGRPVDKEIIRSVSVFLATYFFIFTVSLLMIGIDNFDLTTNFTAVAATMNNIGPGLELVGPTQNFSIYSNFSKIVLIFDMLAGRLELYPMLILFSRNTWRKF